MPEEPGYLRIAADLRARISAGDLPPGAKIPTETALMAEYGVSRTVAKNAVLILKSDGLVEGRRGSGVYVSAVRRLVRGFVGAALLQRRRARSELSFEQLCSSPRA